MHFKGSDFWLNLQSMYGLPSVVWISGYARHGAKFPPQEASKPEARSKWIEFQDRTRCACLNKVDAAWLFVCSLRTHDDTEKSLAALTCSRHLLKALEIEAQEMVQDFFLECNNLILGTGC